MIIIGKERLMEGSYNYSLTRESEDRLGLSKYGSHLLATVELPVKVHSELAIVGAGRLKSLASDYSEYSGSLQSGPSPL